MKPKLDFKPGDLVSARGREWVVLPETRPDLLKLRPLGGAETDATLIYLPIEPETPVAATFAPPNPNKPGSQEAALLLKDALRLKLRAGAGPFRSFGNLNVEPRAYQLVPLLMALKLETVRLLVADDVGIGKTIEAGLIVRELIDRGEIEQFTVICPPHLCEQWHQELAEKFSIDAEIVRTGTATRLERGLRPDESIFAVYPYTVVSLDYIKSDRRRDDFLRACPEFVIVDEAHTCVQLNSTTRHQRYQLLKGLAESRPVRQMVMLTATPHSGNDAAFQNLLGLLEPRFALLADMPEGEERKKLREELAKHFVQRQRSDISEWNDAAGFPTRESREVTYQLTGASGELFNEVLLYARTMVKKAEGGTKLEQRMSWWAALALLRCVSSSPAAALLSLRTRLRKNRQGETEQAQIAEVDRVATETVMDEAAADSLTLDESVPPGTLDPPQPDPLDTPQGTQQPGGTSPRDTLDTPQPDPSEPVLRSLIKRAESLRHRKQDTKINTLIHELRLLIKQGFKPVVFCRYIATAHYVGKEIKAALDNTLDNTDTHITSDISGNMKTSATKTSLPRTPIPKTSATKTHVEVVTGELTSDQREERIEALHNLDSDITPVLVATDCLSEGVNLQEHFDCVIHYDLSWNPTRHEQREGRVDRFGQPSGVVRALMLYGMDNPVDGAVLRVILRKAEKIRKELGVHVPLPKDNDKVIETIMHAVLLSGAHTQTTDQMLFNVETIENVKEIEKEVEVVWETAKAKITRTVFAQRRLRPAEVLPEWEQSVAVLGGQNDVSRFVRVTAERLGAGIEQRNGYSRLPTKHLPKQLQDRLFAIGFKPSAKIAFKRPVPSGVVYIHRCHPLVSTLADYIVEQGLDNDIPEGGARTSAIFTKDVDTRTVLWLLRLRSQISVEQRGAERKYKPLRSLLAEECVQVAVKGGETPEQLSEEDALSLLTLEPGRNMTNGHKTSLITQTLNSINTVQPVFERVARERAQKLLEDHRRIREASNVKGLRYRVTPALPVDTIGVYVFMPMVTIPL